MVPDTTAPTNCCPCGVPLGKGGRRNTSGLCTDCLKKARAVKYEETRHAKKRIADRYPVRNILATPRSTMPSHAKIATEASCVAQNGVSGAERGKVAAETSTDTDFSVRQTTAHSKADRACVAGLASMGEAIKDGIVRFGGAPYELHLSSDQKRYAAKARGTTPTAGWRAVRRFWRDGMGRWREDAILGQRKSDDDESED